jgi:hypothetical protein
LPGNQGAQPVAGGIPGVREERCATEIEDDEESTHCGIMPRAIIVAYVKTAA